jgi:DNA-binding GntR family transcriptional regulator
MTTATAPSNGSPPQGSKAEVAYENIRSRIVDGSYGPGHRLVLDRLARDIGVSSVPVREALRRLEAEGYVDFKRNLGATVCSVDATAYGETMQTLAIVEAAATALAAPLLGKREIRAARKINDAMTASLDRLDPVSFTNRNHELHEMLYRSCPNTYLVGLIEREWARLRGIRQSTFAFVPTRARQAVAEHTKLIDLIESSATTSKIEDYAREHRMRTARALLERYPNGARAADGG